MTRKPLDSENRRTFLTWVLKGAAGAAFLYFSSPAGLQAHTQSSSIGSRLKDPKFKELMNELVSRHKFPREEIEALFGKARFLEKIPELFARPAEDLPYYKYRKIVINGEVISGGKQFLKKHQAVFDEVEKVYGVDQSVIAAILGIETKFGKRTTGGYRVFDALSTIFSGIPRRESFARRELIEFLLLCREEDLDPNAVEGSYAGAMGMPQFIPSSYR
ncbi:MAG TPA: lytic murein transglycosylase, partial [Nitrospiria bacterium]|nr:lytic murein transglycosylase [Nitrospiria bacterium]